MITRTRPSLALLFVLSIAFAAACARHESAPPPPVPPPSPPPPAEASAPPVPVPPALPPAADKPAPEHRRAETEPAGPAHAGIGKLQVSGGIDKTDVDRVLRGHTAALHACYQGARAGKGGRLDLALTISDRGWVTLGEVKRSTLGGGDPEMCIVKELQALRFPHAAEGKEAKVTFTLELPGGRTP